MTTKASLDIETLRYGLDLQHDHVTQHDSTFHVSFGHVLTFHVYSTAFSTCVRLDYSRPLRDVVPELKACARASAWLDRITALGIKVFEPRL